MWRHTWFLFSSAALLQIALHGLGGLSYLVSGTIAVLAIVVGLAVTRLRAHRTVPAGDRP